MAPDGLTCQEALMRLLILTCSARKRGDTAPIPATERYDGPLWRVLRGYQREQPLFAHDLEIYVLSAAFGLIPGTHPVPLYDQSMTAEQADTLRPQVLACFADLMGKEYTHLCLGLSQRYLRAMQGWEALVPARVMVTQTDGPMGTKLAQLRAWLQGEAWEPSAASPSRLVAAASPRGAATVCGVPLHLSRNEVLDQARQALHTDGQNAQRYRDWYVLVDGYPVAPKWLVSLISGVPTSRFDSSRARQVLLALGVDVEHIA
jgi:hypothetical protein